MCAAVATLESGYEASMTSSIRPTPTRTCSPVGAFAPFGHTLWHGRHRLGCVYWLGIRSVPGLVWARYALMGYVVLGLPVGKLEARLRIDWLCCLAGLE